MSEINNAPVKAQKSRNKILVAIIFAMILLLIYGAGIIVLPLSILSSYQGKNCDSVLSLNRVYTSIYPFINQDETLSAPVGECTAYALAASNEKKGLWREAYDAYQAYSSAYPGGLFAAEAHEHQARTLMELAKDQVAQKKYDEGITNLNLIISNYADTSVAADALSLLPSTYISWGDGLREGGDFEKAEQVFNDFRSWSQSNQKTELEVTARNDLVQTYIAWGLALLDQKQFDGALAKFDLATAADPQLQPDTTMQIKAGQRSVYLGWGNNLLEQKQFSAAIEKFQSAISKSDGANEAGVNDALTNGYIQWAHDFSASEDFDSALKQLTTAKQAALSDVMKKSVDTAFSDTYLAFSNSNGTQARRAMKEALLTICKKHKKPDLPIFGLNKDLIHVEIYGVDIQLPETLAAKTPGEMRYITCIEVGNHTLESRAQVFRIDVNNGYFYANLKQARIKIVWNISLRDSITGEEYRNNVIEGGAPPAYPTKWNEYGNGSYYGGQPDVNTLIQWLQKVLK